MKNIFSFSFHLILLEYQKTLPSCGKCLRPVEGKFLKLTGNVFHPECFSCQVTIVIETFQYLLTNILIEGVQVKLGRCPFSCG